MYGVLREYQVGCCVIDDLVHRASEGFVPLISSVSGFVSYTMMEHADEGGLITLSIFADQAGAEESARLAASWVKYNLLALVATPPRSTTGRFSIRTVREMRHHGQYVFQRYQVDPRHVEGLLRRLSSSLVQLLSNAPGFAKYGVLDDGMGRLVSLSAFADLASAEAANTLSLGWIQANLPGLILNRPEVSTAEVKLRVGSASSFQEYGKHPAAFAVM